MKAKLIVTRRPQGKSLHGRSRRRCLITNTELRQIKWESVIFVSFRK